MGKIMKKIALLLITIFAAQAQLLLSGEKNESPYFKHLHRLKESSQLKQKCLDAKENKGPVRVLAACNLLENDLECIVEFHKERHKENPDMIPFEKGGEKRPKLFDSYNFDIQNAICTIVQNVDHKKEYSNLLMLADQINKEEEYLAYLADLKENK